ncbi:MAG: thioredoxin [Bacteroidales bacterium]|nr:thioredoxin [Bacteroidales bacterium]
MKKMLLFAALLAVTLSGAAQNKAKESLVKNITYKEFLKDVWDFETSPSTFVFKGKTAAIVDFYADWCGPCRKVAPIMEKLAETYKGKLTIYKVNVDKEKQLAGVFGVRSIPTMLFIPKEGQPMMQKGALSEADYVKIIEESLLK